MFTLSCATKRIVNMQLDIVDLKSFEGMHRCYNLSRHNELVLSRNKKLYCLIITNKTS